MPRQRWEYTVLSYPTSGDGWLEGFVEGVSTEGGDGWEAVAVIARTDDTSHLLLKRPK